MRQIVVRVPAETYKALQRRARIEDRTMAQTVRRALRVYLAGPVS